MPWRAPHDPRPRSLPASIHGSAADRLCHTTTPPSSLTTTPPSSLRLMARARRSAQRSSDWRWRCLTTTCRLRRCNRRRPWPCAAAMQCLPSISLRPRRHPPQLRSWVSCALCTRRSQLRVRFGRATAQWKPSRCTRCSPRAALRWRGYGSSRCTTPACWARRLS